MERLIYHEIGFFHNYVGYVYDRTHRKAGSGHFNLSTNLKLSPLAVTTRWEQNTSTASSKLQTLVSRNDRKPMTTQGTCPSDPPSMRRTVAVKFFLFSLFFFLFCRVRFSRKASDIWWWATFSRKIARIPPHHHHIEHKSSDIVRHIDSVFMYFVFYLDS